MKKPILLCIMDGFGLAPESKGNAISQANLPNINMLMEKYNYKKMYAAEKPVGLPDGQMGNSEVGHLNIGAGRIVNQSLVLINNAIEDGSFLEKEKLINAVTNAKKNNKNVHILGLLSDGGVHSHNTHFNGMLELCKKYGLEDSTYIHGFLDGRDVAPDSANKYIQEIQAKISELNCGKIATLSGRYYAMDRDNRWDRVELAYNAMVLNKGSKIENIEEYIANEYKEKRLDEFVTPGYTNDAKEIEDGDSVIFINFRPDRAIEISKAITMKNFDGFKREKIVDVNFSCMMKYSDEVVGDVIFKNQNLNNTLGDFLSDKGYNQLRIAETEKYPHVTFFFDGGVDKEIEGSKRVLISSPKVATYDMQPEMSAFEVTENVLKEIDSNIHDVIILNLANPDMVGHTGVIEATINALESVDDCVGKIYDKLSEKNGIMLLTADHGNAEKMLDEKGNVVTSHTTSQVPFLITDKSLNIKDNGKLGDIAPTILDLLGEEKPVEMTGESLIIK